MDAFSCDNCGRVYPDEGVVHVCPHCGGVYDLSGGLPYDPRQIDGSLPGIWRYRHTFGLPDEAPVVTMGEGGTPLVLARAFEKEIAFKLEYLNPTGSFKDRGTALLTGILLGRGVEAAVEDSSGNAGASFAAYAARAGIRARVYVPDYASGPKQAQIGVYGADVLRVPGPRSAAAGAVLQAVEAGAVYASHAYLPFGGPGMATIAYELVEQLGRPPGTVIAPVGHGSLLLGIARGFSALKAAEVIDTIPMMVGVQALACAPLWALFSMGPAGLGRVVEGETLAEGVRIRHPLRGDALLAYMAEHGGLFLAVEEGDIPPGRAELAHRGFYVEPTSAIVWPALAQVVNRVPEPIVAVLTGSGLKAPF